MTDWQSRRDKTQADQERIRAAYASTNRRAQAESVTDRDGIDRIAAEELKSNGLPADQLHIDFVTDAVLTTFQKAARKHVLRGFGQLFSNAREMITIMKKASVPGYLNPPQSSVHPVWAGEDDWLVQPILDPSAEAMLRRIIGDLHPIDEGPDEPPTIRAFGPWLKMQPTGPSGEDPGAVVLMAAKVPIGMFAPDDAARIWPTLLQLQARGESLRVACSVYGSGYEDMRLELLLPAEFEL